MLEPVYVVFGRVVNPKRRGEWEKERFSIFALALAPSPDEAIEKVFGEMAARRKRWIRRYDEMIVAESLEKEFLSSPHLPVMREAWSAALLSTCKLAAP